MTRTQVEDRAQALLAAYRGTPIDSLDIDPDTAHAMRDCAFDLWIARGRTVVGRKIGLTSDAVRSRLGAPEQTDGFLFADMRVPNGENIDAASLHAPLVEAELAIILGADIEAPGPEPRTLLPFIAGGSAAIEIVDSRIANWKIDYADAIADNGSAALFVLSDVVRPFSDAADMTWRIRLSGRQSHVESAKGDPVEILADLHWLAVKAARIGKPLKAGEIILTGALAGVRPVAAGDSFAVTIDGYGGCSVAFRGGQSTPVATLSTNARPNGEIKMRTAK
jgi:2-keto-4-pentenoate hydratase